MKVTIYQIVPELDSHHLLFMDFEYFLKSGYVNPPAEIYQLVFQDDISANNLEDIYRIFNRVSEEDTQFLEKIGYTGRSLSISDVVEISNSNNSKSTFYFCDRIGFRKILFEREHRRKRKSNKNQIRCADCSYCNEFRKIGNNRSEFRCKHPEQDYIIDYFLKHRMSKSPGFLGFGKAWSHSVPVKTSPAWCPLKKRISQIDS